VRHRVYVPEMGRWTRRDPIGYVDGVGLYEYVNNNAVRMTDPSGQVALVLCNRHVLTVCALALARVSAMPPCVAVAYALILFPECMCAFPIVLGIELAEIKRCLVTATAVPVTVSAAITTILFKGIRPPRGFPQCPPCGPIQFQWNIVPPSAPHWPCTGSHMHLLVPFQHPVNCQCFNMRLGPICY